MTAVDDAADAMVDADAALLEQLGGHRARQGIPVAVVAQRMGVTPRTVVDLERYDADPPLSLVRRYALAIGAVVSHAVVAD